MIKLIELSALGLFFHTGYEAYKLHKLKKIEDKIKTAISFDLSYEQIDESVINKEILIATSVSEISVQGKKVENFILNINNEALLSRHAPNYRLRKWRNGTTCADSQQIHFQVFNLQRNKRKTFLL